ncbi:MAG: hypothetical protein KJO07_00720 [Deltaproteobacteria bacterium]|jgi:hypothetical protein|nr:hypothetical protein [Deltaproteobacteria bacterium]
MGESPKRSDSASPLTIPEAYSVHGVIDTERYSGGFGELEEQWFAEGEELEG